MATIRDTLAQGRHLLRLSTQASSTGAGLDALVLLEHVLGIERTAFYAYPEREVPVEQEQQFLALIQRRAQGEPIAYLTGHKEFYGRDFLVDKHVLIPRPESELLVEAALHTIRTRCTQGRIPIVADIGTGSGVIPVTLAVEEPRLPYLYATDISPDALSVAHLNSQKHHVEQHVRLLLGDLLAPLPEPVDILTANLPYVGTHEIEILSPDVYHYEPHLALFSGPDGLDLVQRLLIEAQQSHILQVGAVLFLEIGYQQREPLARFLSDLWPQATITFEKDYAGWDRVLQITT